MDDLAHRGRRAKAVAGNGAEAGQDPWSFPIVVCIHGEPASKANSRQLVIVGGKWCPVCKKRTGRPASIKSKKARCFVASVKEQLTPLPVLIPKKVELNVSIHIWYCTRRPDMDESLILDALEGIIYENDRQVRERHTYHHLDKEEPRALLVIRRRSAICEESGLP